MKRFFGWLAVALLLVAYDVYLLTCRLSEVQGNVEAQFIIITPMFIAQHLLSRRQHAQTQDRLDAQDAAQAAHAAELAAHRADLAEHRKDLAVVAKEVGEIHDVHVNGRLPKRIVRPYSGEAPAT